MSDSDSDRPTRPSLTSQLVNLLRGEPRRTERVQRVSEEFAKPSHTLSARLSDHPARVDDTGSFKLNAIEDNKAFVIAAHHSAMDALRAKCERLAMERADTERTCEHLRAIIESTPGTSARESMLLAENHRLREERRKREGR